MTEATIRYGIRGTVEATLWSTFLQRLRRYGFVLAAYIITTLVTTANWQGDTVDYVESIALFNRGVNHYMWDFAHLFWRPLGWLLSVVFAPITSLFVGNDDRLNVMLTLMCVNWIAGAFCVILIHSIVHRATGERTWIANVVAVAFIYTQTFLNWAQTGSAYVPGFALLLLGFHILITPNDGPERQDWRLAMYAGSALAGAICLWVPYLLTAPAALFAPLFLFGFSRNRMRFAFQTAIACAFLTGAAYLTVIVGLKLHTVDQVRAWISSSAHGVDYSGAARVVFGFARSFINMVNEGLLFKRYLISDPFNPVSLHDLLGATLLKLVIFYVFLATIVFNLFRSQHRTRILPLFILNSVPVMLLAYSFGGSEPERYLPLYPALFIAISVALRGPSRIARAIILAFISVMIVSNSALMARPVLYRKQEAAVSRVRDLLPRLNGRTMVFVATYQDELITFSRTYPFDPINRSGRFHIDALISPGTSWNLRWREDFASRSLSTWSGSGEVWISKRVLSAHPRAEWNWAEGADRRVSWSDLYRLFSRLELTDDVGGPDGFVRLSHSSGNERILGALCAKGRA